MQKLSQQYLLAGDARDVEAARQGDIIFYRELDLEPGVYTIESVVFDAGAQHGSARVTTLNVPAVDRGPSMSSLVLVNRIEETSDTSQPDARRGRRCTSAARCSIRTSASRSARRRSGNCRSTSHSMAAAADAAVKAQLLRNGQALAEAPVPLPAATGSRVQHVGRLPIAGLPVGDLRAQDHGERRGRELSRTAFFTLIE